MGRLLLELGGITGPAFPAGGWEIRTRPCLSMESVAWQLGQVPSVLGITCILQFGQVMKFMFVSSFRSVSCADNPDIPRKNILPSFSPKQGENFC
jgi:hypothetical protein